MVTEITNYSSDGDKPKKVMTSDIQEIEDADLFRLAGGGSATAIMELVRRHPELGFTDEEEEVAR